ncbi:MAG: ribonuclease P protein subunit [Nitrososphaerota archaeon]|nr:ribonuclease P protein subunit [Candidatus Bathyarchaeota archaeon]MDW8048275.1 ribonuclease P protein subunit [Nitrososphaerota archaeon]
MRIDASILQREFIGLEAKVVRSANPSKVGIKGRITNETKKTFTLLHNGREKMIVKETSTFHVKFPDGTVIEIDGKVLIGRPEDRVKRVVRRRW